MASSVYKLLEHSWAYNLVQLVFAPGQVADITRLLRGLPEGFRSGRTLDVGCGPASWLSRVGIRPVGLDLNVDYLKRLALADQQAVGGSADALPFVDGSFDCATSIGVLHHLPDEIAAAALREMVRVVRHTAWCMFSTTYSRNASTGDPSPMRSGGSIGAATFARKSACAIWWRVRSPVRLMSGG